MQINGDRLLQSLSAMAAIGRTPEGGVTRLALSYEDWKARTQLRTWCVQAGLELRVDDIGNQFARRAGTTDGPPILMGSHLDSVPNGGRFDGVLGVLAALEVLRTLNDHGVTTRLPIDLVNWTNEEGVRFQPSLLGSGAVLGAHDREYAYRQLDHDGTQFHQALSHIGFMGDVDNRPTDATAYLELHVEQGPVLERLGQPVGVVHGIIGETWHRLTIHGRADHAGPSPMDMRQDAMVAAAELTLAARDIAVRLGAPSVATVGELHVAPNAINVIPDHVTMTVDLRNPELDALRRMFTDLMALAGDITLRTGVRIEADELEIIEPMPFDAGVIAAVGRATEACGFPGNDLWSGAGHDAYHAARRWPTGMIFVRSKGGVSHSPDEFSSDEDVIAGTNVLLQTVLELADGESQRSVD